jgi:hypothetical protein
MEKPLSDDRADRHSTDPSQYSPCPDPEPNDEGDQPTGLRFEMVGVGDERRGFEVAEEQQTEKDGDNGKRDEGKGEEQTRGKQEERWMGEKKSRSELDNRDCSRELLPTDPEEPTRQTGEQERDKAEDP